MVRRSGGNESKLSMYELPGGVLGDREQPEDGLRRHLSDKLSIKHANIQLHDVVLTPSSDDNPDLYTLSIAYTANMSGEKMNLGPTYSRYIWADNNKLQQLDLTPATRGILDKISVLNTRISTHSSGVVNHTAEANRAIIYADGGSRGNPGHSAAGFVVFDSAGQVIHEGGEYLGITTNNQAEYHGVRLGLEKAAELGIGRVDFRLDSMLVVNQMKGIYQVKNRDLWPINERIKDLLFKFDKVTFSHVRREFNRHADSLVNKILDEHEREEADRLML